MNLDKLPFNWFDFVLVVVLVVGVFRGRKHGMSEELLPLLKWLAILFVCAFTYEPVGKLMAGSFTPLSCYVIAYIGVGLLVAAGFAGLKRAARAQPHDIVARWRVESAEATRRFLDSLT